MAEQWHTTQVGLPSTVVDLAQSLDSVLSAMITILNTARTILDIIKTFMIGVLDPLSILLQQIINDIEGMLQDFDQIGVYYTGDFGPELEWPYPTLQGGYSAYEQRMLGKLLNRNDPTRPDFSSSSQVVALFLYVAANPTGDVSPLLDLIEKVSRFLGQKGTHGRPYPAPVPMDVRYGTDTTSLGQWGSTSDILTDGLSPTVANMRWRLSPPVKDGQIRFPLPPPSGFLIQVSTVRDGLSLAWDGPSTNATKDTEGVQNRQDGLVLGPDGNPFKLYGGKGILTEDASLAWTPSGDTYTCPAMESGGSVKDGGLRVYAYQNSADNVPIPLSSLRTADGRYLLQRTFFYDSTMLLGALFTPGHPFSFKLNHEDMPYNASFEDAGNGKVKVTVDAEPARTVYARITACTGKVTATGGETETTFSYNLSGSAVAGAQKTGLVHLTADQSYVSDPSSPITITYPEASFVNFTDTLTVALVVLLLSRADLQPAKDVSVFQAGVAGSATNLELVASNLLPKMLGKHPEQYYQHENGPSQFRKDILIRARLLANEIANQLGTVPNDTLMRYTELPVTLGGKTLTTVTWAELAPGLGSNLTILESLDVSNGVGGDQTVGLALNPLSNGFMTPAVTRARVGSGSLVLDRAPGFLSAGKSIEPIGTGSADMSPVLYSQAQNKMQFCRNVFLDNTDFLDATILVLQFAGATVIPTATTGDWIQYRLFPQGLPEIEAFLTLIDDFLQGLLTGTRDITAMIVQYIEFIEARILELEALLQRIGALLEMVLQINIPAASGLLVTGEGTMGIVSALTGAQNKPSETETGNVIGGGVVLLAGGLPAPILELFKLFFVQEE